MEQRRHFGRIPFGTTTFLEIDDRSITGTLLDISLKGALISLETPIKSDEGRPCRLTVPLSEEVVLNFNAEVVHCQPDRTGIKFTMLDSDTFSHLVRLLELNSGDAEEVEKELRFLAQSREKS